MSIHPALESCHPVVQAWFTEVLGEPTDPQIRGWPLIREGRDELFRAGAKGELPDETRVLYVSPLKALGNDVQKNLLLPLEQLRARAKAWGAARSVTTPNRKGMRRRTSRSRSSMAVTVKGIAVAMRRHSMPSSL